MCTEDYAAVAISRVSGIGPMLYRQLVQCFGGATEVLRSSPRDLVQVPGVSRELARRLAGSEALQEAETILSFCERNGVDVLRADGERYPLALRAFERAPAVLYHRGATDWQTPRTLAIVGTRRMSAAAGQQIERILDPLREYEPLIISGLAHGVDTAAHRRALQIGLPTTAVLGSGLQHVYPYANRKLARDMAGQGGGVLTEYPPWVKPEREHFPARNRIVAMLAQLTLVVESGASGGSMITANMAYEYGRKVGACPGRGGDPGTVGCNTLIKQGKAYLIDDPEDIVKLLEWQPAARQRKQLRLFQSLAPDEQRLMKLLGEASAGMRVDEMSFHLSVPPAKLAGWLLGLEMQGLIAALPGQRYRIIASAGIEG